jgi:hypothetical protein
MREIWPSKWFNMGGKSIILHEKSEVEDISLQNCVKIVVIQSSGFQGQRQIFGLLGYKFKIPVAVSG